MRVVGLIMSAAAGIGLVTVELALDAQDAKAKRKQSDQLAPLPGSYCQYSGIHTLAQVPATTTVTNRHGLTVRCCESCKLFDQIARGVGT